MSLSMKAIDRLFSRLCATYGRRFMDQWGDVPESDVKTVWAHELDGFERNLVALAWALENLPERPMNVIEFRSLCRRAPAPEVPALPEPAPDPARLAAELSKLGQLRASVTGARQAGATDHKQWARSIIGRHSRGEKVGVTPLRFAREALDMVAA